MSHDLDHPDRYVLVNELHARPSPRLTAPCHSVFLAFMEPQDAASRDRSHDFDHLADLANRHGAVRPDPSSSHYSAVLGRHLLRWESHTEFVTYSASAPGLPPKPFDPDAAMVFPKAWQQEAPGKRMTAVMVQVAMMPDNPMDILDLLDEWMVRDGLAVVWVLDEHAVVASDFRIDAAGFMRFALFVTPEVGPGRTGRIVQRLQEMEIYRAMSMLGLHDARDLTQRLNMLDPQLTALVRGMDDGQADQTLQQLLALSAELETLASGTVFRFGATRAYEAIVMDRVRALRETRFNGRQMLHEFMARRYDPAMRTVKSAERRLGQMIDRADRAGELLRTKVDVERSAQNHELMARMDRRADLQLRLQHTVEGLSVVAISYYAVGLLSYMLTPVAIEAGIEKSILIAVATPVAVFGVWFMLRRIKARLHG